MIKLKDKLHVRCMFVSQFRASRHLDIGIVDEQYQLHQFKFSSLLKCMFISDARRKTIDFHLGKFFFDKDSTVVFSASISRLHPLFIYMKILQSNCDFKIFTRDRNRMIARVLALNKTYLKSRPKDNNFTSKHFMTVWNCLIKHERCPWITKYTEEKLYMMSVNEARKQRLLLFGLYYMLVSKYLIKNNHKHDLNQ